MFIISRIYSNKFSRFCRRLSVRKIIFNNWLIFKYLKQLPLYINMDRVAKKQLRIVFNCRRNMDFKTKFRDIIFINITIFKVSIFHVYPFLFDTWINEQLFILVKVLSTCFSIYFPISFQTYFFLKYHFLQRQNFVIIGLSMFSP